MVRNPTKNGDSRPHAGQKAQTTDMKQITLAAVAAGIMFGEEISHGTLIFITYGNQTAKYMKIPTTTVNEATAIFKAILTKAKVSISYPKPYACHSFHSTCLFFLDLVKAQ